MRLNQKLELFNFNKDGVKKIGYIVGSGDKIPDFLTDLGFDVTIMDDKHFSSNNLDQFDVIITGIRAYNTRDNLAAFQKELVKYVEHGGTLISQYNTTGDLVMLNPEFYLLNYHEIVLRMKTPKWIF
ncbi:MAG: hypothetical protein MZV64_46630 [Ignavibacteriales bacterium]|nr:hypothetical protein [Ignavibacteriales bacterium]